MNLNTAADKPLDFYCKDEIRWAQIYKEMNGV